MPGIWSFFSATGLWQSICRHLRMPGINSERLWCSWKKRTKKKRKTKQTQTIKSACGDGGKQSSLARQQHSFWLAFIWAWPFDNRCDWSNLHSLHFYLSQRLSIQNLKVEGQAECAHHGINMPWWMIICLCACINAWLAFSSVCMCWCVCGTVCYVFACSVSTQCWQCVCCVWVCSCVWIPFSIDFQQLSVPAMLRVILSFGLCDLLLDWKLSSLPATPSTLHDDPHQFS